MPTTLTIPEIKGNFYGGYPYAVDLQIGTFESPSTLTISVVNENGSYSTPSLSYQNVVTISMGSLSFKGYLVEYRHNRGVSQKEMELVYEDCSNLLDRYYVGLHKRHGINNGVAAYSPVLNYKENLNDKLSITSPYLIILGRELHPCDVNKDGTIDGTDFANQFDWCDPCPSCPPDKQERKCDELNDLQIFDVGYSFDELCKKIGITTPSIDNIERIIRNYSGSLRDVLQAWCNEFSLSFYWNFGATTIKDGLVLFDRSVPITANTEIDECKATEISLGGSIRNNFASSTISYYQREGNNRSYPCTNSEIYTLQCIRIRDLLNEEFYPSNIDTLIRWRELAICLSYYDGSLRDCLWWFNYYGIYNAEKAKQFVSSDLEISNPYKIRQKASKTLSHFGNMQILEVIDAAHPSFADCKNQMGDDLALFEARSEELKRDDFKPSYYFFVAEMDEQLLLKQASIDEYLAKNFIGNHWLKLTNGPGCGSGGYANLRYGDVRVDCPEGGASWFSSTGDSIFADFAKFGHEQGSKIDTFLADNNTSAQDANKTEVDISLGNGLTKTLNVAQSFIYKKRNASWYPNESEMSNYQSLIDYYKHLCWSLVDRATGGKDSEILKSINPKYAGRPNVALFICQEIDTEGLPITITDIPNFLEPDKLKEIRGQAEDTGGCISYGDANESSSDNEGPILGSYGLADNQCAWVTFDGFGFMTPVQGTELNDTITNSSFDPDGTFTTAGYRVRATCNLNIPVCIPKIQQSVVEISDDIGGAPRQELSFLDISDDDINIFGNRSCVPSRDALLNIHKMKSAALAKSKLAVEKRAEYQMVGVAPDGIPSLSDGLDSVKIVVNDRGVFTNFVVSDKIAQPLSQEVIMTQRLQSMAMRRGNYQTVASYPIKNAGNIKIPGG